MQFETRINENATKMEKCSDEMGGWLTLTLLLILRSARLEYRRLDIQNRLQQMR